MELQGKDGQSWEEVFTERSAPCGPEYSHSLTKILIYLQYLWC